MLGRPFVLDDVGFQHGEQPLADHRDDEIRCGDNTESLIGTSGLNDGSAVVDGEDVVPVHRDRDC